MHHDTSQTRHARGRAASVPTRASGRCRRLLVPGILAAAMAGVAPTPAPAAVWQGGSGDWTDPTNWDLGTDPDDYPGSPSYPAEFSDMDNNGPGEVAINAGDNIVLNANLFMGAGGATVSQTGGTFEAQNRLDNRTEYHISGGTLTDDGSVQLWLTGGTFHVSDNGAWIRGSSTSPVDFQGGESTIHVSGGNLILGRVNMNTNGTGSRTFRVTGTAATNVEADTLFLLPNAAGGTATAEFIFDSNGVDAINVTATGGGAKLILDNGSGSQGDLSVDVSAYGATNGTEGFVLLDYWLANRRAGEFGNVTVTGAGGALTLGSDANSLGHNEYFIAYDDAVVGDGSAIALYFNIVPEPTTVAVSGLGLLGVLARRHRRGA